MASGRTDKGVHARMQVISLRLPSGRDVEDFGEAFGAELARRFPAALGLVRVVKADPSFHAQWSATTKEYRYRFCTAGAPAAWRAFAWDVFNDERLEGFVPRLGEVNALLQEACGTRDFIAFHESSSPQRPRTLYSATFGELAPGLFEARLIGSGFARYQVRFLLGTALRVSSGRLSLEQWRAALEHGMPLKGLRAPALGLVLWEVRYGDGVDPFPRPLRDAAPGLPPEPPFTS